MFSNETKVEYPVNNFKHLKTQWVPSLKYLDVHNHAQLQLAESMCKEWGDITFGE